MPIYGWAGNIPKTLRAESGKDSFPAGGDAGWGKIVAEDKHHGYFRDEIVDAMFEMINDRWKTRKQANLDNLCSLQPHPELVPDFTRRLADKLNIPFLSVVIKIKETDAQKSNKTTIFNVVILMVFLKLLKG